MMLNGKNSYTQMSDRVGCCKQILSRIHDDDELFLTNNCFKSAFGCVIAN